MAARMEQRSSTAADIQNGISYSAKAGYPARSGGKVASYAALAHAAGSRPARS